MTLSTEQLEGRIKLTSRPIPHSEAKEIASRLVNSAFNNKDNRAHFSIPARIDYDDDLLMIAYIEQQEALIAAAANRSTAGFGAEGVDQRGGVPAGWKLVPEEPDEAMLTKGRAAYSAKLSDMYALPPTEHPDEGGGPVGYAYRAMLAAAPKAPTTPDLAVKELEDIHSVFVELASAVFGDDPGDEPDVYASHDYLADIESRTREALRRLSRALAALGGDQGSVASAIAPPSPTHESGCEPSTTVTRAQYDKMEAMMIRWRIAAQRWTPGGSEYMDPVFCEAFIRDARQEAAKTKMALVLAQRELAALKGSRHPSSDGEVQDAPASETTELNTGDNQAEGVG